MRRHTIDGEELLAVRVGLEHLARAVRATHEAWDGTGNPDGLRGEAVPLTARIVAVVDAFDAMVHKRSYRAALTEREAMRRLRAGAGGQFDPAVVAATLKVLLRSANQRPS
jgi:HD-GYP domain-containing protein (c-di-GMP phosphodiesterase class II)